MSDIDATADLVSGAVFAHAVAPAHGDGAEGHGPCPNCGTGITGAFCHGCGQAAHLHRTMAAIGHEIAHGVFHFEGRTWATLPLLAWRPGDLTRRYVHGQRARFNSPLALFLFSVFLMFAVFHAVHPVGGGIGRAVAQATANQNAVEQQQRAAEAALSVLGSARARIAAIGGDTAEIDRQIAAARARRADARVAADATGAAAALAQHRPIEAHTGVRWLDEMVGRITDNPELLAYKLQTEAYKYSWVIIPISLPFIWLCFCWRRDVTLYDHAVFATHSLTFMTLLAIALVLLTSAGVGGGLLFVAALVVPPLHLYRHLRGAYALGRFGALWRTGWLLLSACIAVALFSALLLSMGLSD